MKAILLVPSEGFREALLGDGPCGARVPVALHSRSRGDWAPYDDRVAGPARMAIDAALVLAWDGAVVREGRDRAAYVLAERNVGRPPHPLGGIGAGVQWGANVSADWASRHADDGDGGAIVWYLDADEYDEGWEYPETWTRPEALPRELVNAWALATVCAARGLGTVVVVP